MKHILESNFQILINYASPESYNSDIVEIFSPSFVYNETPVL